MKELDLQQDLQMSFKQWHFYLIVNLYVKSSQHYQFEALLYFIVTPGLSQ